MPPKEPTAIQDSPDAISMTLNPFKPGDTPPALNEKQQGFLSAVPETYKGKEYVANMVKADNPFDEMFKQYENAQSLVGSRTGLQVPGESATPEQVKEWRKAIGVPDEPTDYTPNSVQWAEEDKPWGEYVEKSRVPGVLEALGKKAHELGLTPNQYKVLTETYETEMVKGIKATMQEQVAQQIERDKDFTQRLQAKYGANTDSVLSEGRKLLEASLDKAELAELADLPPVALAKLTHALSKVSQRYVKEDRSFTASAGKDFISSGGSQFTNAADVDKAARALMFDPAFRDKTSSRHKEVNDKIDSLYKANIKLFTG